MTLHDRIRSMRVAIGDLIGLGPTGTEQDAREAVVRSRRKLLATQEKWREVDLFAGAVQRQRDMNSLAPMFDKAMSRRGPSS